MTAASGRGAAYGDSLARLLERSGDSVEREYYVNDAGTQVRAVRRVDRGADAGRRAARGRLRRRVRRPSSPRAGRARGLGRTTSTRSTRWPPRRCGPGSRRPSSASASAIDTWSSERRLRESGAVEHAVEELRARGHVYESEGAVWLRTTEFGDDKDRVLIRADGEPTYFAPDIAYHLDKIERDHQRLINVLGADHHGYVPRMRAALAALGFDPDRFEAPIMQMVSVVEGGERRRMGKRSGDFVTLDELIDDIGVDATRFFMLQRSHDTTIDIDLELARSTSQDNPVYYVQYAHARIASILRKAAEEGVAGSEAEVAAHGLRRGGAGRRRRADRAGAGPPAARAARQRSRSAPSAGRRTGCARTRWRPRPTSTPSIATAGWSAPRSPAPRRRG